MCTVIKFFFLFKKFNIFCFARVLEYQMKTQVGDFISYIVS